MAPATWTPEEITAAAPDHWPRVTGTARRLLPDLVPQLQEWRDRGIGLECRKPDHSNDWLRLKFTRGTLTEGQYAALKAAELVPMQGTLLALLRAACRDPHPWLRAFTEEINMLEHRIDRGHIILARLVKGEVVTKPDGSPFALDEVRSTLIERMVAAELLCLTVLEATDSSGWLERLVHHASAWQTLAMTAQGLSRAMVSHPVPVEPELTIYVVEQVDPAVSTRQYMSIPLGRMLAQIRE